MQKLARAGTGWARRYRCVKRKLFQPTQPQQDDRAGLAG